MIVVIAAAIETDRFCCPPITLNIKKRFKSTVYQSSTVGNLSIYLNKAAKTATRCGSACLQDHSCKSFSYCKSDKLCHLYSATKPGNKTKLTPPSCVNFKDDQQGSGELNLLCDFKQSMLNKFTDYRPTCLGSL